MGIGANVVVGPGVSSDTSQDVAMDICVSLDLEIGIDIGLCLHIGIDVGVSLYSEESAGVCLDLQARKGLGVVVGKANRSCNCSLYLF